MIYSFEDFVLDTSLFELRKAEERIKMEPQVFDILAYLVEHRDRLVTKDEIVEKVWGDRFISDAALNSRLMAARRAIGDNGKDQRMIRTQHGRGFRFVAEAVGTEIDSRGPSAPQTKPAGASERVKQEVRFCTASDGTRIAYAVMGSGPVLMKAPNWLTHLEYELLSPVWRHWWEELAKEFTVVRFDQRGSGLSDWEVEDLSFERWVGDMESVVEAVGVDRFNLLGISQGGSVACEYTVRHPERVKKLVLYGAFTQGRLARGESAEELKAVMTLMRQGWGRDNPAYRQMFTSLFMPEATAEEMTWFNDLQRISTSGENAARLQQAGGAIDILDHLPQVSAPTLVLHATGDERVPFTQGRLLASTIPNARLVALDSRNHLTLKDEPAWSRLLAEVRTFLAEPESS